MFIFTEKAMEDIYNEDIYIESDNDKTFLITEKLYPIVENVLNTPEGGRKFTRLVEEYVNRNNEKLTTIGPMYLVPFTMSDKEGYYKLFGITEKDLKDIIKSVIDKMNNKANWALIKNNPIFVLFYMIIRYYTIKKDSKKLNDILVITALSFYPSIFAKYFKYTPNPGVMQYTIDNLSQRFIIKKSKHIFGTLVTSIQNSWKFMEKSIIEGADFNCVRFIQRIRNDQNSLIKKISINYYDNHKKGLTVQTQVDSFDDSIVVDNENDSNRVEQATNKIVLQILLNGVNLKICDFAANAANVSRIEIRNYLTTIITEKNSDSMKRFIESILFLYLYEEKHTYEEINTKAFLSYALALFKKTNSKDMNITNIKKTLDEWGTESGIYSKFSRLATRVDYTRAIYLYFILSIQKYN
jgi:hypothetical protein